MTPLRLLLPLAALTLATLAALVLLEPAATRDGASADLATRDAGSPTAAPVLAPAPDAARDDAPATAPALAAEARPLLDAPPVGHVGPHVPRDGRTARLSGHLTVEGLGVPATLTWQAGPNAGATLTTDDDGRYDWPELFPGLGLLTVAAGHSITRELTLGHRGHDRLELDLGPRAPVLGRLLDEDGAPVPGADLTLDGRPAVSDRDGWFEAERVAPGPALLIVRAPGLVPYRQLVLDGMGSEHRPLEVRLERGRRLHLSVASAPGLGDEPVEVWLLPTAGQRIAGMPPGPAYPWHQLNPIRLRPGETLALDDLPLIKLEAFAHHARAVGREFVWLTKPLPGAERVELHVPMAPTPTSNVRVLRDGLPVAGARVRLEHDNALAASLQARGETVAAMLRSQALAIAPAASQETLSGPDGVAPLGRHGAIRQRAFATVSDPDSGLEVTVALGPAGTTRSVDLAHPERTVESNLAAR